MCRPRIWRISRFETCNRSLPSNSTRPDVSTRVDDGMSLSTDSIVTLLPDPDSPTTPSVSPGYTSKLTPSTACTDSLRVRNVTRRCLIDSSGSLRSGITALLPQARVEGIAQAVAHQVEAQHRQEDGQARERQLVRGLEDERARHAQHRAPLGGRRLHAQAQETQARGDQDRHTDYQRCVEDDRGECVAQHLSLIHI